MKNFLRKIINDEDFKISGFNFVLIYLSGKVLSIALSAIFSLNINKYNSIDHLAIGVLLGTFAYRKAGKGAKGILIGLAAATLFNVLWEGFEIISNPFQSTESMVDVISDVAVVYVGAVISFGLEKVKGVVDKKKLRKK